MANRDVKGAIFDLMCEYRRVKVETVSRNEIARALKLKHGVVQQVLQELISEGRVEYGRKNPRYAEPYFQIAAGALNK